jgi:hypothetical protein
MKRKVAQAKLGGIYRKAAGGRQGAHELFASWDQSTFVIFAVIGT